MGVREATPTISCLVLPNTMPPTASLALGTPMSNCRVPPAPHQPAHTLDKPREMLAKKTLLYLQDGQLNKPTNQTILMKHGLYKTFALQSPCGGFPLNYSILLLPTWFLQIATFITTFILLLTVSRQMIFHFDEEAFEQKPNRSRQSRFCFPIV